MNIRILRRGALLTLGLATAAYGDEGGRGAEAASATASEVAGTQAVPAASSLALSPLTVALAPGGSQQLTVTETYGNATTRTSSASRYRFSSSDTTVATVTSGGLVTAAVASYGATATATITVTDRAARITTAAVASSLITVTVATASGPPTATSIRAATETASSNSVCSAISPFYWEIGDAGEALASASIGTDTTSGAPIVASTRMSIASASKWVYGTYVVQVRGGTAKLTGEDVMFLHFTSGYTNMGSDTTGATCAAPAKGTDSINYCLTLSGANGPFDGMDPSTVGIFDYDSGHEENHAGQFQPELNALAASALGSTIATALGLANSAPLVYSQPLLAGGIFASADDYTPVLRGILSGQLLMHDALGTSPVCAWTQGTDCNAASSPIFTEKWHYSITHWVEDDPTQNNDGAFSSPGAFGFYPWIEAGKTYYGVISRDVPTGGGIQNGVASAQCGALIRHAWDTGKQQTGTLPTL